MERYTPFSIVPPCLRFRNTQTCCQTEGRRYASEEKRRKPHQNCLCYEWVSARCSCDVQAVFTDAKRLGHKERIHSPNHACGQLEINILYSLSQITIAHQGRTFLPEL